MSPEAVMTASGLKNSGDEACDNRALGRLSKGHSLILREEEHHPTKAHQKGSTRMRYVMSRKPGVRMAGSSSAQNGGLYRMI
jgi:hypothetical protein